MLQCRSHKPHTGEAEPRVLARAPRAQTSGSNVAGREEGARRALPPPPPPPPPGLKGLEGSRKGDRSGWAAGASCVRSYCSDCGRTRTRIGLYYRVDDEFSCCFGEIPITASFLARDELVPFGARAQNKPLPPPPPPPPPYTTLLLLRLEPV